MLRPSLASLALLANLALASLFTASSAFAADPEPVQVLSLQSDDAVDQAQALTVALKNAAQHQSLVKLVPGDYSLEVLSLALGCPDTPDDTCLDKIANKIKSPAFVWGTLQKSDKKLDLKLNLYRKNGPSRATEIKYSPKANDTEAANDLADRALSQLLSSKSTKPSEDAGPASGKLLLSADDLEGEIVIDGAPAGTLRDGHAELPLDPGDHDVTVRVDGYREAEGTVTVASGKNVVLRLHPVKLGEPLHPRAPRDESAAEHSSNASAAWGAIIVGGAFGVAGIYSTLRVNSINHDSDFSSYRAGISKNDDACVEANRGRVVPNATTPGRISDLCSQSKTFEALQYVFFGLGAIAAGTGALILLTDEKSAPTSKQDRDARSRPRSHHADIRPSVMLGPNAASFDLRVRF